MKIDIRRIFDVLVKSDIKKGTRILMRGIKMIKPIFRYAISLKDASQGFLEILSERVYL